MKSDLTFAQVIVLIKEARDAGIQAFEYEGLKVRFKPSYDFSDLPSAETESLDNEIQKITESKAKFDMDAFFGQSDKKATVPEMKAEEIVKPMSVLDDLSDEEMLYYATPYFDQIQEEKKIHAQKLKEGHVDG